VSYEKWRIAVEAIGLAALVGSLVFVGMQMRQEHRIAVGELAYARNELFQSRFTAGLESDDYLSAYSTLYATGDWPTDELMKREIAAAEIDAILWWNYLETVYWHRRQELIEDYEWVVWEENVRLGQTLSPVYGAVFRKFWLATPSDFTDAVQRILGEATNDAADTIERKQ
jgi:hypothetical protein